VQKDSTIAGACGGKFFALQISRATFAKGIMPAIFLPRGLFPADLPDE
jgi:hypothetical protein